MGPGPVLEREVGVDPTRQRWNGGHVQESGSGPVMATPPEPPTKAPAPRPAPLKLDPSSSRSSPSLPPNRPLPLRPTTASSAASRIPARAPSRPPPALRPQAPLAMNPPTRPSTAATRTPPTSSTPRFPGSTKRLSWTSIAKRRPIKYGQGKHSRVELVPQPSDDPEDPLNWPTWRKELNFWSLLLMVAMTGVMKTIFMTVNAQLAMSYEVSYTAVAALTGVPLILSAISGFACLVASRICGKRPLYLASLLLVFIGAVWDTNVASSYGQCMAARIFQGFGWGAFDTLVLGSIQDTYFEHERGLRIATYTVVAVTTTWGPPLIGGVASQGPAGPDLQFTILSAFFVVAVPAIALGVPETTFDRALTFAQTPATAASQFKTSLPIAPRRLFSLETLNNYIVKLKPYAYSGPTDLTTLLQAPRAFVTPTTALLALVSFLPFSALWGLAASLSLFFHPLPFFLSPSNIGALFAGPFLLATATAASFALLRPWHARFNRKKHMSAIAAGCALTFTALLAFGLHLNAAMTPPPQQPQQPGGSGPATATRQISIYALSFLAPRASLPALAFVLGLLAAAAHALDATARPLIAASTAFTGSSLAVATRNTADMTAGLACWRALLAGAFVLAAPNAAWDWAGLKGFCVGVAVAQVLVGLAAAAAWWFWGEGIRRWDGRVMRLVDLASLRGSGSFFEMD